MAQRSHVPKFGNWDNDNVPYTAYFDNARKEKTSLPGLRINPNDPEENPEAFLMFGRSEAAPPRLLNLRKSPTEENKQVEGHSGSKSHRGTTSGHQLMSGGTTRALNSEYSSEKSNSDSSHRRKRSQPSDGSGSISPPVRAPSSRTRLKNIGNPLSDDSTHRVASVSVPKFGAWDETDPASGEGFTVIFNQVKQERQVAATTLPTVPPPNTFHSNTRKTNQNSPSGSKICCCFRP